MTVKPMSNSRKDLKEVVSDTLEYKENKLFMYQTIPLTCLKIIKDRFKIYVDYGFKGNARYADDKSDYYVVDLKDGKIYSAGMKEYTVLVASLEEAWEQETPFSEKVAPFITETRILTMTIQNLIQDGWSFVEREDGELVALSEEVEEKVFKDENKYKKWIMVQAENY